MRELFVARLRVATVVSLLLHVAGYAAFPNEDATTVSMAVRIGLVPFMALLLLMSFLPQTKKASPYLSILMLLSWAGFIVWNNAVAGNPFDTEAILLLLPAGGLLFPYRLRASLFLAVVTCAIYFWVAIVFRNMGAMIDVMAGGFYVLAAATLFVVGTHVAYRLREREFRAQRELEVLLNNTLPKSIVERLKKDPGAIADGFDEATVLFADIANFTELSSQLTPAQLVQFLNGLFSGVDSIIEKHGLEKIKTIGDAYMVAGGLPELRPDHCEAVARLALEMRDRAREVMTPTGVPLQLRVGIHCGPVVAGVIGTKKLNYDLWGDTVNTAARMEGHAEAGMIQVSEVAYQRLRANFDLEKRGVIDVKGKGLMTTYWLLGERAVAVS